MDRERFKVLVKAMKATYPQDTFIPDKDAFDVWYSMLQDLPYEVCSLAIQKYIMTRKFPPTIADIREMATEAMQRDLMPISELEAWAIVKKAISNSGYNSVEEFNKLPEVCQIAVGNPSNLREWAMMNTEQVDTIEQSHFIKSYRSAAMRMSEDARLPDKVKTLISDVCKQYQIGQKQEKVQEIPEKEAAKVEDKEPDNKPMPDEVRMKLEELYNSLGGEKR